MKNLTRMSTTIAKSNTDRNQHARKTHFNSFLIFVLITFLSAKSSALQAQDLIPTQDLKVCIFTAYDEKLSLVIHDFSSAGDVKTVDGFEDATSTGCGIWTESGTYTKSTKTFNLDGYNLNNPTNCIGCAYTHSLTFVSTSRFHMNHTFTNNCGSGGYSAWVFIGCSCSSSQLNEERSSEISSNNNPRGNSGTMITDLQDSRGSEHLYVDRTGINLYPNPTSGTITLDLSLNEKSTSTATIKILNLLGQIIYSENVSVTDGELKKEITLDHSLADGMYVARVMVNDKIYSAQLIYQK